MMVMAACAKPQTIRIHPTIARIYHTPPPLTLQVAQFTDGRPEWQKTGHPPKYGEGFKSFLPLVLVFTWSRAGSICTDSACFVEQDNLAPAVTESVKEAVESSRICKLASGSNADLLLEGEIVHMYAAMFKKSSGMFSPFGAAMTTDYAFLPYGLAEIHLRLYDVRGGNKILVWDEYVRGFYNPDAADKFLSTGKTPPVTVAVAAFTDFCQKLPYELQPVLARIENAQPEPDEPSARIFYIAKLSKYGDYLEMASIERDSGKIASDKVITRVVPAFSKPGEWVLDPYQNTAARLSPSKYEALAEDLKQSYDLRKITEYDVYHLIQFRGDVDGDGIPEEVDECPGEAETFNGYMDRDGCPDAPPFESNLVLTGIDFDGGGANLSQDSFSAVQDLAEKIKNWPKMKFQIVGHTDDKIPRIKAQTLSFARANAVRDLLISMGVPADRLQAVGMGSEKPIEDNSTRQGRQANNRIEIVVLQ